MSRVPSKEKIVEAKLKGCLYNTDIRLMIKDTTENREKLAFKELGKHPGKLYNFKTGRLIVDNDRNRKMLGLVSKSTSDGKNRSKKCYAVKYDAIFDL
jgi:hypothetical protein